jgi:hypothetical protein
MRALYSEVGSDVSRAPARWAVSGRDRDFGAGSRAQQIHRGSGVTGRCAWRHVPTFLWSISNPVGDSPSATADCQCPLTRGSVAFRARVTRKRTIYCGLEIDTGKAHVDTHLITALAAADESVRLKAALAIGSHPEPGLLDILVERCAIEPDFYVRDMLTWALIRLPSEITVPRLIAELRSERAQARSQALHTLSKIKDAGAWSAITRRLLRDCDDEVARSAWRAAVVLVPNGQEKALAEELATQLGRGDRDVQLSLSRALVCLGEEVIEPVLQNAAMSADPAVQAHASATARILRDPDAGSERAVDAAKRRFVLGKK